MPWHRTAFVGPTFEDQDDATWRQDIELGQDGTGIKADRISQWNERWAVSGDATIRDSCVAPLMSRYRDR